jgi:uncharacterized protein YndB with AHSA1/START domain
MPDAITRELVIHALLSRVWRAVSDHREFGTWFRAEIDGPFEEGRRVEGRMTQPGAMGMPFVARITALRPQTFLAFEWPAFVEGEGVLEDEPWTLVEIRLVPEGEATRVTVTESGFDRLPARVRDRIWRENEGGWAAQARNLAQHVAPRAA